jgi:peptidoglycan/xylan/chitin deacetylase (PgdA/CDA1 family)
MHHRYFIKTPWIVKKIYSEYVWSLPADEKKVYLTFDDGPTPVVTPWVLDLLKKYNAAATFFCIGKNVELYPDLYQRLIKEGHATGNHTQHHLNGWKTDTATYLKDVSEAASLIKTNLFRPPYGRIKSAQAKGIGEAIGNDVPHVIMWDVLSADFDTDYTPQQCLDNVLSNVVPGSIVVFHDSQKAFRNLEFILPVTMKYLKEEGYKCSKISL